MHSSLLTQHPAGRPAREAMRVTALCGLAPPTAALVGVTDQLPVPLLFMWC